MNKFLVVLSLVGLACAGCEKKEPKPVVAPAEVGENIIRPPSENIIRPPSSSARAPSFTERADVALRKLGEKNRRRDESQANADGLKSELEKTGRIVRDKTAVADEKLTTPTDNARIVTVVKNKLAADPEIFASKINVDASQGVVSLTGSVGSTDSLGRTIQLALDTEGVNRVVSLLTIDAPK